MKFIALLAVLLLPLVARPATAATTLCIQAYPSSYDPGPSDHTGTRVDVASTSSRQGYTLYSFGPGTGGGGDPANQQAFFHFAFPDNYFDNTFTPVLEVSSHDTQTGLVGCWEVGLTANTGGTVYANITGFEGSPQFGNIHPSGTTGGTVILTLPPVTVYDPMISGDCASTACSGMTVVGAVLRVTSICNNNDTAIQDVLDIHMCYTLP